MQAKQRKGQGMGKWSGAVRAISTKKQSERKMGSGALK